MPETIPYNPTTGRPYTGGNVETLLAAQDEGGYPTAQWAGYGQWLAAGRQVQKGQKSTVCKMVVEKKDKDDPKKKTKHVRTIRLFNLAQTAEVEAEASKAA